MNPNQNIHLLKQNWDEHQGKIHSLYYFREEEPLSPNATTPSWIGVGCMVFERWYWQEQPGYFKCRQTRWWEPKEPTPMHPEIVLHKQGKDLTEVLSNIQNSQKLVEVGGEVCMANVIWNIQPER
jgi:hypothetical protein